MSFQVFVINRDSPHAKSLALKLAGPKQPGEIVEVSRGEFWCLQNHMIEMASPEPIGGRPLSVIPLDPTKKHIIVYDIARVGPAHLEELMKALGDRAYAVAIK